MPRKYPTPDPPRPPPPHPHDRSPADQPARSAPDGTHDGDTHPETTQQQITSNRCPSGVANGSLRQLHFPTSEGILTFTTPSQRAPKPRIWVRAPYIGQQSGSSNSISTAGTWKWVKSTRWTWAPRMAAKGGDPGRTVSPTRTAGDIIRLLHFRGGDVVVEVGQRPTTPINRQPILVRPRLLDHSGNLAVFDALVLQEPKNERCQLLPAEMQEAILGGCAEPASTGTTLGRGRRIDPIEQCRGETHTERWPDLRAAPQVPLIHLVNLLLVTDTGNPTRGETGKQYRKPDFACGTR